jgi:probable rRNA maturation factor
MLTLQINNLSDSLVEPESATSELFQRLHTCGRFPFGAGELSIAFVDDATIARIHADFMGDPSPTDVITFPADPTMELAGEIIVSVDHARDRADELGEPFSRELALYLVHGWLHLAGYDDREPKDRQSMRAAEQSALRAIEEAGTFPEFRLKSLAKR